MAIVKYILPALACASRALAANCATDGTLTITATADAAGISGCSTYSGSVAVNTQLAVAKDQNGHQSLAIDGVKEITGNITVTEATNLAQLSFDSLQTAGGIELGDLTVLSQLSAPQFTKVDTMNFTALPALQSMSFGGKGVTQAISVLITNTGLSSLQGINNLESIEIFNVNNNQALTNISLDVKQIKRSLDIEANDGYVSGLAVSFPFLENALNMTFRNCSSVDLPALAVVNQSLGFYGNSFSNFTAANLTQAGGLIFVDNTELSNISLPQLQTINQLYQIANNTMLKKIDGFQKLSTVAGALDFNGNFTDVELPALTRVSGAFNMQTSGQLDCSAFDTYQKNKVIKGKYVCQGKVTKPGGSGTTPSGTSATPSGTGAASHFDANLPAMIGGTSLIAGLLQLLL